MKKSGFTMIELIFVIVILGVLAAVAIPKLNATRDDAEQAKAMTNLATLMGDLTSYYTAQGTFADSITSMTNVPLSATGEFKIKDKTCLTFEVNKNTGDLTITSVAEADANPVCKNLIANTSTQNILSGSYTCQGKFTTTSGSTSVTYTDVNIDDEHTEKGKKDASVGMDTVCQTAAGNMAVAKEATSVDPVSVPAKMDKFGKTITMNFQGGGVAF